MKTLSRSTRSISISIRDGTDTCKPIVASDGIEYQTLREASETTGIDASSINKVLRGRRKSAGGLGWRYKTGRNAKGATNAGSVGVMSSILMRSTMINNIIDNVLDRQLAFVVKAGKRVMPMPPQLHVVPGQRIVGAGDEVYTVESTDWTNIRITLHRRVVIATPIRAFRHLKPIGHQPTNRYGEPPTI